MLEIKNITKDYETGGDVVHALRDVSISFRESELVSVLGQSGCGKTTLLNIIGGLDHYTTGDLIIKVVSLLPIETDLNVNLEEGTLNGYNTAADFTVMAGDSNPKNERNWKTNETQTITVGNTFNVKLPANSFSIIRIKKNKK